MDTTMQYVVENIQGAFLGYCQSDEISIAVADFDGDEPKSSFFEYRLCKVQSIVASLATSKFNQLMAQRYLKANIPICASSSDIYEAAIDLAGKAPLYEFDCKAWNVPTENDAYAWFLYRQNDCVRNSMQQFAQTYVKHGELEGKKADEQVAYILNKLGHDWNAIRDGLKYGRICYRSTVKMHSEEYGDFEREKWAVSEATPFNTDSIIQLKLNRAGNGNTGRN